jgi:hypothetical protein
MMAARSPDGILKSEEKLKRPGAVFVLFSVVERLLAGFTPAGGS